MVALHTSWSGALDRVSDPATGTVHWLANGRYADGQIQTMTVGNQTTSKSYDGFGRVSSIATGSLQSASYSFDALGNLASRSDASAGQSAQSFAYDRLNRLTNDGTTSVGFDAAGNLTSRNGAYSYSPGTHRLISGGGNTYCSDPPTCSSYDANGNLWTITNASGSRTLAYTPFNLPSSVTGTSGYGGTSYLYDGSHARIREVSSGAGSSGTTYYLGGFEAHRRTDGVLELRHYLATPEGVIGIYTARSNGLNDLRYWHKDHLGSVQVIADSAGSVKQGFLYDAWGNRTTRTLAGGEAYAEERSYTGHELLTEIGLVHMNGRIYDPVAGRFLQADPLVQDPFNGQSYNRYGYVLNNPLAFTDPTGFSWWTTWRRPIFAIAAGAATYWLGGQLAWSIIAADGPPTAGAIAGANAFAAAAGGFAAGGIQGGNIESALQGALFAGLNFGVGEITTGPTGASLFGDGAFAANVGLHAAVGCGQQAAAGGSCRAGALAGGFSALAGPVVQGPKPVQFAAHIAIGGFASRLAGDKFENGAMTAAFDYLFNCGAHDCWDKARDDQNVALACRSVGGTSFNHCGLFVYVGDDTHNAQILRQYSLEGFHISFDEQYSTSSTYASDLEAFRNPGGGNLLYRIDVPKGMSGVQFATSVIGLADHYEAPDYLLLMGPNSNSAAAYPILKAGAQVPLVPNAPALLYWRNRNYGN